MHVLDSTRQCTSPAFPPSDYTDTVKTILGTAIPKITDEFHDLNKVSWYGAAYFMTFGGGELKSPRRPWTRMLTPYPERALLVDNDHLLFFEA